MTLIDFIDKYSIRGACQCGACADALNDPKDHQPDVRLHTSDVVFFNVALINATDDEMPLVQGMLRGLIEAEVPGLLDAMNEINYMHLGAIVGDQGYALQLMGLGEILGLWEVMTPKKMLAGFGLTESQLMLMARTGYVTIRPSHKVKENLDTKTA